MVKKGFLIVFVITSAMCANQGAADDWLLKYIGNTSLPFDKRFDKLCKSIVPENWVDEVEEIMGGPRDACSVVDKIYVMTSACKLHECSNNIFFWYDLKQSKGIVVIGYITENRVPACFISKQYKKQDLPKVFFDQVNIWAKKQKIQMDTVEYCLSEVPEKVLKANENSSKGLPQKYKESLSLFKSGKKADAAQSLLKAIGPQPWNIDASNVYIFNDLGYFLEESSDFTDATIILNAVLTTFPERTVAYFNLGDAYWGLKDTAKAKAAYAKYADLMKKDENGKKIPARVLERIK